MIVSSWISGLALAVLLLACGGTPTQHQAGADASAGVIESIGHLDRTASAGVAGVLASGALKTPSGSSSSAASTAPAAAASGAIASAIAQTPSDRFDPPGYRVNVRLDSGALKSIDQADVVELRVGQRVRIEKDRVVPR